MKAIATAALLICLAICGCGSDDAQDQGQGQGQSAPSSQAASPTPGATAKADQPGDRSRPQGEATTTTPPDPDPDPRIQRLRENFPKPTPTPSAKELSAKAIASGEAACRGLSPEEVKERFYAEAESNLDPGQRELIEELPRYEEEAPDDPDYVAGQIAATIYGATLGKAESQYGFQGCVYSLFRALAAEISEEGVGQ